MRMLNIDGDVVQVDVRGSKYPRRAISRSEFQGKVGVVLDESFPFETILEEFYIPGSKMSVDFFIPTQKLIIEADGAQHFEHNPFFHGDRATQHTLAKQKSRDRLIHQWADSNGFQLISVPEGADENEIRAIVGRTQKVR